MSDCVASLRITSIIALTNGDVDEAIKNSRKALEIMNYEIGELVLACALYTKWASFLNYPEKQEEAKKYFDQAWSIYPNLNEVIEITKFINQQMSQQ